MGETKARSITDILKDADNATRLQQLIDLWNEIANNKYQYPLIQIFFANEHIRELVLKLNESDLEQGKFYIALAEQTK